VLKTIYTIYNSCVLFKFLISMHQSYLIFLHFQKIKIKYSNIAVVSIDVGWPFAEFLCFATWIMIGLDNVWSNVYHNLCCLKPNATGGWGEQPIQWQPGVVDTNRLKAPPSAANWTDDWNARKVMLEILLCMLTNFNLQVEHSIMWMNLYISSLLFVMLA